MRKGRLSLLLTPRMWGRADCTIASRWQAASIGVAPVLEEPEMTEEQRAEVVAEAVGERLNEIQELLER